MVTAVGEISDVKTGPFGSALHERDYVDDGTPIITVEHLGDSRVVHRDLPRVSDGDTLIESTQQLLNKKRQLKQGAVHELLTGSKRLRGFSGEWEATRLGELGATFGGLTGKTKKDFGRGPASYITFMNIMTNVVI